MSPESESAPLGPADQTCLLEHRQCAHLTERHLQHVHEPQRTELLGDLRRLRLPSLALERDLPLEARVERLYAADSASSMGVSASLLSGSAESVPEAAALGFFRSRVASTSANQQRASRSRWWAEN